MNIIKQNINIDPNKLVTEVCECGSVYWKRALVLKEVPGLLMGRLNNELLTLDIIVCAKCETPHISSKIILPEKITSNQ